MGAKLIIAGLPSDAPDEAQDFYARVLDYDFAPSLSDEDAYHAIASADGVDFAITVRHSDQEPPMAHFAVDDLDQALAEVDAAGGSVVFGPTELIVPDEALELYRQLHQKERGPDTVTNSAGRVAIIRDPSGGMVGLTEPAPHTSEHFQVGRFAQQLSQKQLRVHREAIRIGKKWKQKK